jgi:hypothetical protein
MIKLHQFKLLDFNEDQQEILYRLWKRHLKKDPWWHFFYEGDYTLLRVSEIFLKKTGVFLQRKKVRFHFNGVWKDNIKTTKKYQEQFMYIFHGYSEIAMKTMGEGNSVVGPLLDRVTHCFMNNMSSRFRRIKMKQYWEPNMIATCAAERALTIGYILGGWSAKKSEQTEEGKAS